MTPYLVTCQSCHSDHTGRFRLPMLPKHVKAVGTPTCPVRRPSRHTLPEQFDSLNLTPLPELLGSTMARSSTVSCMASCSQGHPTSASELQDGFYVMPGHTDPHSWPERFGRGRQPFTWPIILTSSSLANKYFA